MLACLLAFSLIGALDAADGTILVLENSHPIVELCTRSEVTHVGMVITESDQKIVYEATPSVVRKLTLEDYFREIGDMNRRRDDDERITVRLYQPTRPYSAAERAALVKYLDSQIGRRYSVRGYFRDRPGTGIHCAELVSSALARTGRYQFPPYYSINPGSLVAQIRPSHDVISSRIPVEPKRGTWCSRSWTWWSDAFNWCGWACRETVAICR